MKRLLGKSSLSVYSHLEFDNDRKCNLHVVHLFATTHLFSKGVHREHGDDESHLYSLQSHARHLGGGSRQNPY